MLTVTMMKMMIIMIVDDFRSQDLAEIIFCNKLDTFRAIDHFRLIYNKNWRFCLCTSAG